MYPFNTSIWKYIYLMHMLDFVRRWISQLNIWPPSEYTHLYPRSFQHIFCIIMHRLESTMSELLLLLLGAIYVHVLIYSKFIPWKIYHCSLSSLRCDFLFKIWKLHKKSFRGYQVLLTSFSSNKWLYVKNMH